MAKRSIAELSKVLHQKKARWTAAENHISKMSPAQRKKMLGVDLKSVSTVPHGFVAMSQNYSLPSSVDWRNNNGNHVTNVKDQGGCGSCVSFGTVAVTESMVSIERGQMLDLSEADQHFCSSHGATCNGWNPQDAFGQIQARGVVDEADFPYASAFPGPVCTISADRESRIVKISNIQALNSNDDAKNHLATVGPIACVFDVYDDFFSYQSGVYNHVTGVLEGSHCVEIVGYSDTDNCWICKNSWNSNWGDNGYVKIAYGTCNIDYYTKFGVTGVILPAQWGRFELMPAQRAATDGSITVVSRIPGSMEIFWIGADGSVNDAYWYEGGSWGNFVLAPAGSASPNGSITAVSRIPGSMEVFWIGADGSVQDAYWYDGSTTGWGRFTLAPAGSASADGSIKVVSRIPGSMELFWIGPDGSVHDAYWYEGNTSWSSYILAPAGSASTNGSITAVSRIPGSMEIFWIGADGSVQDAYWYDGSTTGWGRFTLAPAGSASTNGSITAVSRIPGSMELFWIGADGSVQDAYWYDGSTTGWGRFTLAPAGSASVHGSIKVVSRIQSSMELFWTGPDGTIHDAFWYEGNTGWTSFVLAPAGSASPGGSVTAVSRIPGSMEVFWVGYDGSVQDAYWYDH